MKYVFFFNEAGEADIDLIGKKGVNLALLSKKGFKVPPGFIVSNAVFDTIKEDKNIKSMLDKYLGSKDDTILTQIYGKIRKFEFSESVMDEIIEAYLSLSVDVNMNVNSMLKSKEEFVAVRSCVVGEQVAKGISHKTVLNVKGQERLFNAIKESFAGNFVIELKNNESTQLSFGVVVQKMIESEKSGVVFSATDDNADKITIKAVFGLGEGIRTGNVFPDTYLVDKKTNEIESTDVAQKQFEYSRDIDTNETVKHRLGEKSLKQVLYDNEINEVARVTKKIVNEFGTEQKVSWAIKGDIIYVIQTKSINDNNDKEDTVEMEILGDASDDKVPDVIDITEPDLEDDLQALDEIEKIEQDPQSEKVEDESLPEIDVIDLDASPVQEEISKDDVVVEPQFHDLVEDKVEEQVEEHVEEQVKDQVEEHVEEKVEEHVEKKVEEHVEEKVEDIVEEKVDVFNEPVVEQVAQEEESPSYTLFGVPEETDDKLEETEPDEPEFGESEKKVEEELFEKTIETDDDVEINETKKEEDDSIFSDYKDFEKFKVVDEPIVNKPVLSKTKELALLNAGNTVVYCHMVVKEKLMDRLRKYTSEVPKDFGEIIDELTQYEPVENEDNIRKINQVRNNFVNNHEYPSADDVGMSLRLI